MEVQFWAATDVGRVREHNEDNFLVDKRLSLFIVADGMGGHAAGEVASAVAVRAIREVIANNRGILDRQRDAPDDPKVRHELLKLLEYAVQEACTRIFDMAQQSPDKRGMGTTCSLLLVGGRRSFIAHVGDSRIYRLREGQVRQITEDHSLINEMIRQGKLQEGVEPSSVPYKNAITRAVGVYETVEVDTFEFENRDGDRLLLCSDGLSMYLDPERLGRFLSGAGGPADRAELKGIVEELIAYGNSRGGKDNITAVLVGLSGADEGASAADRDHRATLETLRGTPLFHYLAYGELQRVLQVAQRRALHEGEGLLREGEPGEELFILLRGECVVERAGQELARLGPGRHFGEMALVDDQPRSASVRATQPGVALVIRRPDFYELLREDSALAVKLLWNFIQTLSARLRDNIAVSAMPAPARSGGLRAPTVAADWALDEADLEVVEEVELEPEEISGVSPTAITPEQGIPRVPTRPRSLSLSGSGFNPAVAATLPPALGMRSPFGARSGEETTPRARLDLESATATTEPSLPALQRDEPSGEFAAIKRHRHRPRGQEEE